MSLLNKISESHISLSRIMEIFTAALLMTSITATAYIAYTFAEKTMIDQVAKSRIDVLAGISERTSALMRIITTFSDLYYYNQPILSDLCTLEPSSNNFEEFKSQLNKINVQNNKALITNGIPMDYMILMNNGFSYSSKDTNFSTTLHDLRKELWQFDFTKNRDMITWIPSYNDISSTDKRRIFSATRAIIDSNKDIAGLFFVNIEEKVLFQNYTNLLNKNNCIYIIDNFGKIVSHPDKNLIGFNFYNMERLNGMFKDKNYTIIQKNKVNYLFSIYKNDYNGWIIAEEIPVQEIMQPLKNIQKLIVLGGIIVFIIGIFFAYFICIRITRPLQLLCNELKKVGKDDEEVTFNIRGWKEVSLIYTECQNMMNRIKHLIKSTKMAERKKRKAELDFLYSQINPHFMYNTLFSIKCFMEMGSTKEAVMMLTDYISLLKNVLDIREELASIENELKLIEEYITIQKYRYGEKFNITVNCKEELKKYKVPRLIMQPIVENAIFHGIVPMDTNGNITIDIDNDECNLRIVISDDGVGYDINSPQVKTANFNKIGIANVHERIQYTFGDEYGLTMNSEVNKGTKAIMCLPLVK